MDIGENFETSQQQQLNQEQQQPQQQMQCDPSYHATNGDSQNVQMDQLSPLELPMQTAIPLPAAPQKYENQNNPAEFPTMPSPTEIDIDAVLLQQFSCLGTTDHDDLINQFHSLMNNQVSKNAARFFLEMSNWNLQTAVGCYLDYFTYQMLPSMKIVQQFRPNEQQRVWRIQNDGTEHWPKGCYLMSTSQACRVEMPCIRPGDTCDISADVPPTLPTVMWRLCTPNGWYFGDQIWLIPQGTPENQSDLTERMALLKTNTPGPESCPQVKISISINME